MSIVRKNGDGKYRIDWGTLITSLVLLLLSGAITGFGSYYAIQYDIRQANYRITIAEHKIDTIDGTVNAIRLKDAMDSEAFKNACTVLGEIKDQLKEIRQDQIRRARGSN